MAEVAGIFFSYSTLLYIACRKVIGDFFGFSDKLGKCKVFVITGLNFIIIANLLYSSSCIYIIIIIIRATQNIGAILALIATLALVSELSSSKKPKV